MLASELHSSKNPSNDRADRLLKGTMATTDHPDELLEPGRVVGTSIYYYL